MSKKFTVSDTVSAIKEKLERFYHVTPEEASDEHFYKATALWCRELMSKNYKEFKAEAEAQQKKTVYYLCMEFLMGRSLKNNLYNLGLTDTVASALKKMGANIDKIYEQEPDAGLGAAIDDSFAIAKDSRDLYEQLQLDAHALAELMKKEKI